MSAERDDVAIVGMAGVFPAAPDLRAFWDNILARRCCITDHPDPQARRVLDPDARCFERLYTIRGGFLHGAATFDPVEFGVMPDSVAGGDPSHFLALKLARDALADAGMLGDRLPCERTDVIIGYGTYVNPGNANWIQHGLVLDQTVDLLRRVLPHASDARIEQLREELRASLPPLDAQVIPAVIPNVLTGRIANRLDLRGANYVIDAACASSLIAVQNAAASLLLGRCDVALAGGLTACMPIQGLMVFCQLGALSRQPALRPFDRHADGTLLGEGMGLVVLRRRRDAERDGDRIYALIKGLGVASDGRATGLLAPRLEGEVLAIRRAYADAQIDPATVELVEAHGTGVPLGDATEVRALDAVLGDRPAGSAECAIGSVKSMIGHTIAAAGIAGLIKTVLSLHHRVLPATLSCDEPHPDLELGKTPFYVNTENRPWIHARRHTPRRAGVSAMGFGGINAHCVLEEYPGDHG